MRRPPSSQASGQALTGGVGVDDVCAQLRQLGENVGREVRVRRVGDVDPQVVVGKPSSSSSSGVSDTSPGEPLAGSDWVA